MAKAQDSLRAASDRWNADMLAANRHVLIREARARRTKECVAPKMFLRLLDGQITWRDRTEIEHHLTACWCCVDLLCCFREVIFLARSTQALPESQMEAYLKLMNFETPRSSRWKLPLGRK